MTRKDEPPRPRLRCHRCVDPSLGLTGCKQWVGVLGYTME